MSLSFLAGPKDFQCECRMVDFVNDLSLHFVFERGTFAGSSIYIHGRIPLDEPVRESVVVGGNGHFRFARGYTISKNYDYSLATGAIIEFNVYVL